MKRDIKFWTMHCTFNEFATSATTDTDHMFVIHVGVYVPCSCL